MARGLTNEEASGQEKFGRFYLRELLNSGGMADIWLASDSRGKPYALRKLKKELRFNFTARRRFSRGNWRALRKEKRRGDIWPIAVWMAKRSRVLDWAMRPRVARRCCGT